MVQKAAKNKQSAAKPLSSLENNTVYEQSCIIENVNNCNVKNKKMYRTRFVNNSSHNLSKIQSLVAMSKSKAFELYRKTCTPSVSTNITGKVFTQDGCQCGQTASKMRSLCDGCLFSSVVTGKAPGKADFQCSANTSGLTSDEIERGHIASPIHSESIEKHADECHKVVDGADNADQKMKIFDINGLEDKYLNSILNRACHFTSTPDCDSESYKKWKAQSDFNFGFVPLGEFQLSESQEIHEMSHYCPIKVHVILKQYKKPNF